VEERYETDLAHSQRVLDDVDRALERLTEGTYGSCETCGAPIYGADLEADPTRRVCEQHLALDPATSPTGGNDVRSDRDVRPDTDLGTNIDFSSDTDFSPDTGF
jgi:hypothetical protein